MKIYFRIYIFTWNKALKHCFDWVAFITCILFYQKCDEVIDTTVTSPVSALRFVFTTARCKFCGWGSCQLALDYSISSNNFSYCGIDRFVLKNNTWLLYNSLERISIFQTGNDWNFYSRAYLHPRIERFLREKKQNQDWLFKSLFRAKIAL